MTKILVLFFALVCFAQVAAASPQNNELMLLNDLIANTERSLETQKQLRSLIQTYQKLQLEYVNSSDDVDLLYQMVKVAQKATALIQENQLALSFDPEFLTELTLFANMANKKPNKN